MKPVVASVTLLIFALLAVAALIETIVQHFRNKSK